MKRPYPIIVNIISTDQIELPINKLQVLQTEDKIEEIFYILRRKYYKKYEIFRTAPRQLEILPCGISKGRALLQLMKLHNWSSKDVIALEMEKMMSVSLRLLNLVTLWDSLVIL